MKIYDFDKDTGCKIYETFSRKSFYLQRAETDRCSQKEIEEHFGGNPEDYYLFYTYSDYIPNFRKLNIDRKYIIIEVSKRELISYIRKGVQESRKKIGTFGRVYDYLLRYTNENI